MESGTGVALNVVWGTSSRGISVVGQSGLALHYDGVGWRTTATGIG
jgi:hypothetical protein